MESSPEKYTKAIAGMLKAVDGETAADENIIQYALELWEDSNMLREDLLVALVDAGITLKVLSDFFGLTISGMQYILTHYQPGESVEIPE